MMLFKKSFLLPVFMLLSSPTFSHSIYWSRFIETQNQQDVSISFRQLYKNQAWSIQWYVQNKGQDKVEPILISRRYLCKNGESLQLQQASLGVYLPNSDRLSDIKDTGVCPNSSIKFVEITSEIIKQS